MKKLNFFLLLLCLTHVIFAQQKRLALVIGNAAYQHGGVLKNPVNDAELMSRTLQNMGFEVITKTNADLKTMQLATADFTKRIPNYDVALFFYAGHGIQVDGANYLIPIDAKLDDKLMCQFEAFDVSFINKAFMGNNSKVNIMILDACRNNPYRSWMRDAGGRGFKAVSNQPAGTIIAFATREGETASDGTGNNGLFTEKLVQEMNVAQNITEVFQNTRVQVLKASSNAQCPQEWNMLTDNFYFTTQNNNSGGGSTAVVVNTPSVGNATNTGNATGVSVGTATSTITYGKINLTTEITGELYLDGLFLANIQAHTNIPLENVQSGYRNLEIRGKQETWNGSINVNQNQTATITAKTSLKYSSINLTTEIAGDLYLDNVKLGAVQANTKVPIQNVLTGNRKLEIKGNINWTATVNVTEGNAANVTAKSTAKDLPTNFIFVQGGTFTMGSTDGDSDEKPTRQVTVSSFYLSKYEVTQKEYADIMGSNPSNFTGDLNCPVEKVSWYDALVYCNRRSIKEGLTPCYSINGSSDPSRWGAVPTSSNSTWDAVVCSWSANGYRLPTEAEWEYAAGGGSSNRTKWAGTNSESSLGNYAWYGSNSGNKTHPVAKTSPNALGIYDMSGNVWEWCWDWKGTYPSTAETNPKGAGNGSYRVLRGGSWYNFSSFCRSADRDYGYPGGRSYDIGFRLVRY